jgi:hypothetical protein
MTYDVEADAWEEGAATMPYGVNHAASATYNDLLYVAGGRMGRNRVGPGFDYLQIYDPATNEWELGPPLPVARGGMGKAVVLDGLMYVFGGESDVNGPNDETGLTATNVFTRVDVLDLATLEWTLVSARLPTVRPVPECSAQAQHSYMTTRHSLLPAAGHPNDSAPPWHLPCGRPKRSGVPGWRRRQERQLSVAGQHCIHPVKPGMVLC